MHYFSYIALGGCVVLFILILIVFRKNARTVTELSAREDALQSLESELTFKENFQQQVSGVMADIENSSKHLTILFQELCRMFDFRFGFFGYVDDYAPKPLTNQYPDTWVVAEGLFPRIRSLLNQAQGRNWSELQVLTDEEVDQLGPVVPEHAESMVLMPFMHRGKLLGGLLMAMDQSVFERRQGDIHQLWLTLDALVSYLVLRDEIAYRIEESNILSLFLTEISAANDPESLFNKIHTFFEDNYSQQNITLLLRDDEGHSYAKRGYLVDEKSVHKLLPWSMQQISKGQLVLYAPDSNSFVHKYHFREAPSDLKSIMILPLVAMGRVMGFVVFESFDAHPFKLTTLNSLVRISELISFILQKVVFFQEQLDLRKSEKDEIKVLLDQSIDKIRENEKIIQEFSSFNSVFSLAQSVKSHLTTLRGFVDLLQENIQQKAPVANDPILFRNCQVEVDKIERSIQKFELVRIITDPDFMFRSEEVNASELLDRVILSIRTKSLMKKAELEIKFDPRSSTLILDPDLTFLALQQFMERLLDYMSGGKIQALSVLKTGLMQILFKYIPPENGAGNKLWERLRDDFREDFSFILVSKVIQKQGGEINLEFFVERGFLLRISFPENTLTQADTHVSI